MSEAITRVATKLRAARLCPRNMHWHLWPTVGGSMCLCCGVFILDVFKPRDKQDKWKGARSKWHR